MAILIISILSLSTVICKDDSLLWIATDSTFNDILFQLKKVIVSRCFIGDK